MIGVMQKSHIIRTSSGTLIGIENDERCPYTVDGMCPYTPDKKWNGKCYDGSACNYPYLDTYVKVLSPPHGYCKQQKLPFWIIELMRTGQEIKLAAV